MINAFYEEDIIKRLGAVFTYGLDKGYSPKTIEERIVASSFINALERNEYDIESKIEGVVEKTFDVGPIESADISFKGLFFAESYFWLFLYVQRSFEYLFLYWPLSFFVERYGIYHEMDFSNLRRDFDVAVRETPLLKRLAKSRGIRLNDISKLTGINQNTINKYSRDDKYLLGASHETIYKLAMLFGVKENVFVSNLEVYLDQTAYLFADSTQDYRNYLGFYFAQYFDERINKIDFRYNRPQDRFDSANGLKLLVLYAPLEELSVESINRTVDGNTYLVIILSGFFGDELSLTHLAKIEAREVLVKTQEFVFFPKRGVRKEITDTVNRSLNVRAKEAIRIL